jgi:hypothetical protein
MIHDATVEVTCDAEGCRESVVLNPEYVYRSYSEKSGYYDTSDKAMKRRLEAEGWTVAGEGDDEKTYCEECSKEMGSESKEGDDDD